MRYSGSIIAKNKVLLPILSTIGVDSSRRVAYDDIDYEIGSDIVHITDSSVTESNYDYVYLKDTFFRIVMMCPDPSGALLVLDKPVTEHFRNLFLYYSDTDARNIHNWSINLGKIKSINNQYVELKEPFKSGYIYKLTLKNPVEQVSPPGTISPQDFYFRCPHTIVKTNYDNMEEGRGFIRLHFSEEIKEIIVSGITVDLIEYDNNYVTIWTPEKGERSISIVSVTDINDNKIEGFNLKVNIKPNVDIVRIGSDQFTVSKRKRVSIEDYVMTGSIQWLHENNLI